MNVNSIVRCDQCDNGLETEWICCPWCGYKDGITLEDAVQQIVALRDALKPFGKIAAKYDQRVYPADTDSQGVSVSLGDCRRALLAMQKSHTGARAQELDPK
jgi:hypothetical protein